MCSLSFDGGNDDAPVQQPGENQKTADQEEKRQSR
jgi:hypothetical protein